MDKITKVKNTFKNIPSINVVPKESNYCFYNDVGQKVCYQLPLNDKILCDQEKCKMSFKTINQHYLSKKFPKGIHIGIRPRGAFSTLHIFGMFPKIQLESVKSLLSNQIKIEDVDELQNPTFVLPSPPKKCRYTIWGDSCRPYVESLDWKWNIFKGWKNTKN